MDIKQEMEVEVFEAVGDEVEEDGQHSTLEGKTDIAIIIKEEIDTETIYQCLPSISGLGEDVDWNMPHEDNINIKENVDISIKEEVGVQPLLHTNGDEKSTDQSTYEVSKMAWNQKQKVQARDPDTGIWLAAVVLTVDEEAIKVKWVNYRGRTSYVGPLEEIRQPILRRQLRICPILWPSTKPEFLRAGDQVQHLNVDGTRGQLLSVESNDPFRGVMLTSEHPGRDYRYEHLAEPAGGEEEEGQDRQNDDDVLMQSFEEVHEAQDSDEENSLSDANTSPRRQATPARTQGTPARRRGRAQAAPVRRRGTATTHVKKKMATILDFGQAMVFPEEIPTQELQQLAPEETLVGMGDLARQVAQLEKEPTFELPEQMAPDILLQQNITLIQRNRELTKEKEALQGQLQALEARVTAIEAKVNQPTPPIQGSTNQPPQEPEQQTTPTVDAVAQPARRSHLLLLQANSPSRVAVELSKELFTTEERLNCCVNGKGAARLDPVKVAVIRERLFETCLVPRGNRAATWTAAVKAIDGHTRYLRLKERRGRDVRP